MESSTEEQPVLKIKLKKQKAIKLLILAFLLLVYFIFSDKAVQL